MSWYPQGLPSPFLNFARAIDGRFQLRIPNGPTKLSAYTATELQSAPPTDYCVAMNSTTKKPVFGSLNDTGTAWIWRYSDGTAV